MATRLSPGEWESRCPSKMLNRALAPVCVLFACCLRFLDLHQAQSALAEEGMTEANT